MPDTLVTPPTTEETKKRKYRKRTERKFDGSDAEYAAHSRVKLKHFTNHLPQFTTFDPDFDATYATNWLAKIEACEALTPDTSAMHEMAGYKVKLEKKVSELVSKISVIEFFATQAFENEPEVLYEFQFNKVNRPDQYNLGFIINAHVIKALADDDYNGELLVAGMQPTALTELEATLDETTSLEILHEKFKRTRIKHARIRVKEMNRLFDITDAVRKAANVIYVEKPETKRLFV